MSAGLLPESASVGVVLKAEADVGLDGLEIVAVFAPKERGPVDDRLELIGRTPDPPVTTTLVSRGGRPYSPEDRADGARSRRGAGARRGEKRDGRRGPRRGERTADEGTRTGHDGDNRQRRGAARPDRGSRRTDRRDGDAGDRKPRRDRAERSDARSSETDRHSRPGSGRDADDKRSRNRDQGTRDSRPPSPRSRMPALKARRVHRQAALKLLPPEQQELAREVLRGGVPGVRKSIDLMNTKAAAESLPPIKSEPLIALAETLAPILKAAEWHDRADAALAGIAEIDLRDIRSVIAAAERSARSDETRALAENLRKGLALRLEVDHRKWLDELASTIHEGRTVRALRLSSRPPKAGTPLPPDMAERLANMAAADLNSTANQQRWATVVDSVAFSPVRTQVVPAGIPEKPTDELLGAIRRLADRVPQVAALFGVAPAGPRPGRRPPPPPSRPQEQAAEEPQHPEEQAATQEPQPTEEQAAEEPQHPEEQAATQEPQPTEEQAAEEPQPTEEQAATQEAPPAVEEPQSSSGDRPEGEKTAQ